ncbi:hypothetical protein J6590_105819 [Homalodisca vitripennis]|nr:hypothetical protein J6590_105819 [Homalodisca vitripennis]
MKSFPDKLLRFCQIVGGLPVESTSLAREIKALTFSNTGFLWSITLVILQEFLSSITLYMHFMDKLNDQYLRSFDRSIDIVITVDLVSLQVVTAVTFFSSAWKNSRLAGVFDTLERVYQELQHNTSEVKRTVKLLGIYAVALMIVSICYRMVLMNHSDQAFSLAISIVTIVLLFCSQAALLVHFTHVAQSIAKSFEIVNLVLRVGFANALSNIIKKRYSK